MEPGYRDKLIMHAFYPKRVPFFNPTTLKIVLFYGALFELVEKRVLRIEDNRIICNATETGDKVLDTVIDLIAPYCTPFGKETITSSDGCSAKGRNGL